MCTVTYLPGPAGFILTHNRDEAPNRSTQSIVKGKTPKGNTLLFPRDAQAGGTWIASSKDGKTACLLNGAFVLHRRELPYRRSRGLLLLDFFDWDDPDAFFQEYDLDRIEPFTFLYFEKPSNESAVQRVTELRWDGLQRFLKELSPQTPHFWCSATLYPPEMQIRREQVFRDWLNRQSSLPAVALAKEGPGVALVNQGPTITSKGSAFAKASADKQSLITLHQTGSINDPENDYVMNRAGRVQTVSITQVVVDEKNAQMKYLDLLGGNRSERRLITNKRAAKAVNR